MQRKKHDPVMNFGMLRGMPLSEVPITYLHWMVRHLSIQVEPYPDRSEWAALALEKLYEYGANETAFYDIANEKAREFLGLGALPTGTAFTKHYDLVKVPSGGYAFLIPGLVMSWHRCAGSPIEAFEAGDCVRLVGKTDEDPHGYKNPQGNWKVKSKAGITVWASIQSLVKAGVLLPVTAGGPVKPRVDPDGFKLGRTSREQWPNVTANGVEIGFDDFKQVPFFEKEMEHRHRAVCTWNDKDGTEESTAYEVGFDLAEGEKAEVSAGFDTKHAKGDLVIIESAVKRGGTVAEVASKGRIAAVYNERLPIQYLVDTGYFATSKIYEESELRKPGFAIKDLPSNKPRWSKRRWLMLGVMLSIIVNLAILGYIHRHELYDFLTTEVATIDESGVTWTWGE